jgi:hypothetical protein
MPDEETDCETSVDARTQNLNEVDELRTTDIAPTLSNICITCDNLFNIPRPYKIKWEPILFHHTLEMLKSSARECEICALIDAQITVGHINLERENELYRDKPLTCVQLPSWLHYWNILFLLGDMDICVAQITLISIPGMFSPLIIARPHLPQIRPRSSASTGNQ